MTSLVRSLGLLLPCHPAQVFFGEVHQVLELPDPLVTDFAGSMRHTGLIQQPFGFFVVGAGYVKRMFKGGVVFPES